MTISSVNKVEPDLSNLQIVLKEYDYWMKDHEKDVSVNGKTYSKACSEQAGLLGFYMELSDELGIIVDELNARLKEAKAKALKKLINISAKSYTEKQLLMLIEDDPMVVALGRAVREVRERSDKSKSVVSAFTQRGYILKYMSSNRAGEFHNEIMHINE